METKTINKSELPEVLGQGEFIKGLAQLAVFLGVSYPTALKLKQAGEIPFRQVGNHFYFEKSEIMEAIKKGGPND